MLNGGRRQSFQVDYSKAYSCSVGNGELCSGLINLKHRAIAVGSVMHWPRAVSMLFKADAQYPIKSDRLIDVLTPKDD